MLVFKPTLYLQKKRDQWSYLVPRTILSSLEEHQFHAYYFLKEGRFYVLIGSPPQELTTFYIHRKLYNAQTKNKNPQYKSLVPKEIINAHNLNREKKYFIVLRLTSVVLVKKFKSFQGYEITFLTKS